MGDWIGGTSPQLYNEKRQEVELLTAQEREALAVSGRLANMMARIIEAGNSPTIDQDKMEMVFLIHNIQHFIMAQAAARAYPDEFRLLGGVIPNG